MRGVHAAVALALLIGVAQPMAEASETARAASSVEIVASQRAFTPDTLSLPVGQPVTLIIRNEDEGLHAFVPLLLFLRANVQIGGNSAPEFNEAGLARVLIPPHGRVELRFTPKTIGTFSYICDLPGHIMRGEIHVR